MKRIAVIAALVVALAVPCAAQNLQLDKVTIEGFAMLTVTDKSYTLSGSPESKVRITAKDGSFAAKADRVVVTKDAKGSYQTAKLTGGVWLKASTEPTKVTTATADNALIDYAKAQEAVLSGSVHITSTDPDLFVGPATVVGDRAIISLNSKLGPDEPRIRIESTPEKSRLEFTPKKPQESASKTPEEKK